MMKRGLAAFLTGIMTVTLMAAGLTGCGSNTADKETEKVRLMVWSPSEDQSKDSGEWLQTMCNNFAKEHPEWNITFVYGVADEASAADQVHRTRKQAQMYLCMQMTGLHRLQMRMQ